LARDPRHLIGAISGQQPASQAAAGGRPSGEAWSVSEVVGRIEAALTESFGRLEVTGEISSFKRWRNGHWYFDLRDRNSVLPCTMRGTHNSRTDVEPEDGMQVLATGRIGYYRQQGKAQLVVTQLRELGRGELLEKLERIKGRLASEGLFDTGRKRALPAHPHRVGVVTSPQGAALQDILKVLRTRSPGVSVLLSPTRVQGHGASKDIAEALRRLDGLGRCDVIIIGRGGGALEDLMSFNMEVVARAIAGCATPVISSVGHETDTTLADLVADARAATPTHAAQLAVRETAAMHEKLRVCERRLEGEMRLLAHRSQQRLSTSARRLDDASRAHRQVAGQTLSELQHRLAACAPGRALADRRRRLDDVRHRLAACSPAGRLQAERERLSRSDLRLTQQVLTRRKEAGHELAAMSARLRALSPLAVLERGYALVEADDGLRTSIEDVAVGDELKLRFADGAARVEVKAVGPTGAPSSTGRADARTDDSRDRD
jgi:exodeoxyribonuclease VII large subunit